MGHGCSSLAADYIKISNDDDGISTMRIKDSPDKFCIEKLSGQDHCFTGESLDFTGKNVDA